MKAPFSLRWSIAWAVLTGKYLSVSFAHDPFYNSEPRYRVDVTRESVRWWKRRNKRRSDRLAARKAAEK